MTVSIRELFGIAGEQPQGDAFAQYGEQANPAHVGHSSNRYAVKHTADLSPLEKKLRERQALSKKYPAWRAAHRREMLSLEPRLRDLTRYLRQVPACGDDLPAVLAESWLPQASKPIRLMALELITRRCDQINRASGFVPLDDPLPITLGGSDDTRARCAAVLYPDGRL